MSSGISSGKSDGAGRRHDSDLVGGGCPVRVKLILGAGGCRHVHVTNAATGEPLAVITQDDFGQDENDADVRVVRRMKFLIARYLASNPGATLGQIRTFIEREEL